MTRTFTGPNSFALKKALQEIRLKFAQEFGDLSIEIIDGEESSFEQVIAAIESVPFLAQKKLIIIYSVSAVKEATDKVESLVIGASETNELIIVEPKVDKRSAYYKYLKSKTELEEFNELDERKLANWLVNEAKDNKAKLNFSDAYYLVQRVGNNQESVSNELKKLTAYDKDISKENIDKLTEASPQTNVFNLLDAAFGGNAKKALKIYDEQRSQGVEPLNVLAMLTWQMHLVALVDSAGKRSDSEIMRESNMKPFVLNKSKAIARRMGRPGIGNMLNKLVETDKQLKTTSVNPDDALKNLLLSLQNLHI
ncbi:MAG TPA: DNA polymerase III subunit delta [Patescibacteria group bacterium]|nr:DNA polymerase III subunit delta [Patescibacteria group bacterium]